MRVLRWLLQGLLRIRGPGAQVERPRLHDGRGPREGRRGRVFAVWGDVLAVYRRVLEVVRAEDFLFLRDEAELVARAEETAASDAGFVCEDLVLDRAWEEDLCVVSDSDVLEERAQVLVTRDAKDAPQA